VGPPHLVTEKTVDGLSAPAEFLGKGLPAEGGGLDPLFEQQLRVGGHQYSLFGILPTLAEIVVAGVGGTAATAKVMSAIPILPAGHHQGHGPGTDGQ
jgi:hypothetical protein